MGSSARINILGGLVRHAHVCSPTFPSDSLLFPLLSLSLSLSLFLSFFISSRLLSWFLERLLFLPQDRLNWRIKQPKFARASNYLVVDFRYSFQISFQRRHVLRRNGYVFIQNWKECEFRIFIFVCLITRKLITVRYIFLPSSMDVELTHRSVQQETLVRRSRRKSTNKSVSSLNSDRSNDESRVQAISAIVDSRNFPQRATKVRYDAK